MDRPEGNPGLPGNVGVEDETVAMIGQFIARRQDHLLRTGGHHRLPEPMSL